MKLPVLAALTTTLITSLSAQTVLEWALSETSPNPDVDDTPSLGGTLAVPIVGDASDGDADSSALIGRFTPVTLAAENDSITISYDVIFIGGFGSGAANADFRWGLFNSQGTSFTGEEADLSGWTGAYAFNSGSTINDADIYVRDTVNTDRFYVSAGATDITGASDFANQDFDSDGVIYTATLTITRLAGDVMDIAATLTGDDGYSFSLGGQETVNAEFTFDRIGFWINSLSADQVAFKESSAPDSTDGDSIPDLEEVRWFTNLTAADDSSNSDGDALSDLDEITVTFTDPTDAGDPPPQLPALFVDFNADGTAGQIGPNSETDYVAYTAPHESNSIDDPAGLDFPVFGTTVNLAVDYTDDDDFTAFPVTVKQMIGRDNTATAAYDGTMAELMRDWVGIDSRAAEGGNGPVGNAFGTPTNMTFTLTGIPAGDYEYRAYHHDVANIEGNFELTITDATRTNTSLGNFQMTASAPTEGNPVYDATGNKGTAGVDAGTLTFAAGEEPPTGGETRTLLGANIGQAVVSGGTLEVYLDDFPASLTGTSNDRTWLQGIGYMSTSGSEITYVDVTLLNTDIVGGGADSLWADGDDATTGGTITDGSATNDGLWRFRSAQGNGGIWEATGGSSVAEDCVEIVTSVAVPDDTYDVYVFYYPVNGTGDYPVRAGLTSGAPVPSNPGTGNPPSALASTLTIPFTSDGNPVVFTYRVYEEPGSEALSVVGVNGFEITEAVAGGDLQVTSITKVGNNITLTWISAPGANYDIMAGIDLVGFPTLAADNIASQGTTTTHTFAVPAGLLAEPAVFFVVQDAP
ncbi:hypothetical protein HAHE_06420 [Haloferula helveola]|uniref:Uncharacterized protein n=1 Tax=Haloferula helveola TaxID=490095 RepID=A0ABN6H2U0_9BACT|nr:hypothetical protein HAHE_06420 [Haloferula helveola]